MSLQPSAASIVAREKRSRHRRRRRWLAALGVAVALVLFGFFGLPPIIKAQAVKRLSAELHRDVSIERIRLNPLVLSVTIEGLAIKDRDGGAFTGWRRLYVNFDVFSFFVGEWRFQEIALDGFSQRVVIAKDGTFNFADLLPADSAPSAPKPASTRPPRPVRIASLAVTSAGLSFADASRAQPFATDVGPLSFTLKNFRTAGDPKAPYEFSAITEAGESLSWKGTVSIDPVRSAGEFTLGKIALKKYAPYYANLFNADVLDGLLDVGAHYSVELAEGSRQLALTDAAIKLSSLKIAARGSAVPLVDLPSLSVEGLSADGLKPSATIKRISLEGGRLSVVREADGSINLLKLLTPEKPAGAAAVVPVAATTPATPAALPDVRLAEFSLTGLAIDFEDRTTPKPAKNVISRLDVSVKNFSLAEPASPVALTLSAAISPSGMLSVEGTATREPLAADIGIKVVTLPFADATPYLEPLVNLRIASGSLSVDGRVGLTGGIANFRGAVSVDNLALVDAVNAEDFVKFTQLSIIGVDVVSEPLTARIAEISLTDPLARIAINADKTTNLATILRSDRPSAPVTVALPATEAAPVSKAPAPVWSLGKFTLSNGTFTFDDHSIKPAVRLSLDHFGGTVGGLSSADLKRADVNIRGRVNGTGAVSLAGKLDAKSATLAPKAATDLTLAIKDVDLSPISPYIGTYAGYELARSGLVVDVKARLAQRKINSSNVVTLKQFTLGAATNSPVATKLPVRLGVALLKDNSGNIVIDLPVNGSLDDPEFRIGRVVMRVVVNILTKAATSPFSLIGAAFGGGGDELAYQEFTAGAVTPLDTESKKIETLRKALEARPALNLDITGSYDAEADLAALRDELLMKQVRYRRWEELRAIDPSTPARSEITVTPEDEARILGLFIAERYPKDLPVVTADGQVNAPPLSPPAPNISVAKPKKPVVVFRTQRVFSGRPPATTKPRPAPAKKPAVVVLAPTQDAAVPAPAAGAVPQLTLADARRALAAGIPMSDDSLLKLATDRAQHVRDALLEGGQIDAGRLFLTPPAPVGKGARVFLQLR